MHHPAFYIDNSLVIYKIHIYIYKSCFKNNKADPRKWIYTFFLYSISFPSLLITQGIGLSKHKIFHIYLSHSHSNAFPGHALCRGSETPRSEMCKTLHIACKSWSHSVSSEFQPVMVTPQISCSDT